MLSQPIRDDRRLPARHPIGDHDAGQPWRSGAAGADSWGIYPSISDQARYVTFDHTGPAASRRTTRTKEYDVYVRDLQDHVTSLESRATPGYERYVRPAGATPLRVPLVPAYTECVTREPDPWPTACVRLLRAAEPSLAQPHLAERDIGRSIGYVRFGVKVGAFGALDDADVNIRFSLTNVMNAADFSDYTGELRARATVRITDKSSDTPGGTAFESTVCDFPFEFTTPCVATDSTAGGTCSLTTTADAVVGARFRAGANPHRLWLGPGEGVRWRTRRRRGHAGQLSC